MNSPRTTQPGAHVRSAAVADIAVSGLGLQRNASPTAVHAAFGTLLAVLRMSTHSENFWAGGPSAGNKDGPRTPPYPPRPPPSCIHHRPPNNGRQPAQPRPWGPERTNP